jgi:DNA-binding NarL/FixJ family response regulator
MSVSILLVDDHRMMREGLRLLLDQESEFRVVGEAADGRMAVELARQLQPDVVIMDIGMPDLNGIEATRKMRDASGSSRIIALSTYSDKRYVLGMLGAGASGYVLKSAAAEELVRAIQQVMCGEKYLSPDLTGTVVGEYLERMVSPKATQGQLLGPREREVLQMLAEGKTSKEIAAQLFIAVKTVDMHRQNIMNKLDLHSVAELTKYAIREGMTRLEA